MLTEAIKGKAIEEAAQLSSSIVLEMVGVGINARRMKCAMLGAEGGEKRGARWERSMAGRSRGLTQPILWLCARDAIHR
jgi:NifU-like protein involved in Fe-S cluster formation